MSSVHSLSKHPGEFTRIRPRPEHEYEEGSRRNIEGLERVVSVLVGLVMICGLFQQSWLGVLTSMVGAFLLYRGTTGHCPICTLIASESTELDDVEVGEGSVQPMEVEAGMPSLSGRRRQATPVRQEKVDWSELEELPPETARPASYRVRGAEITRSRPSREGRGTAH